MNVAFILFLTASILSISAVEVSLEPISDAVLQYDNGTANWVTWAGSYRGVWFDTQDFYSWPCSIDVSSAEVWFYHHSMYPWDTGVALIELWNGDPVTGFTDFLASNQANAMHYAPADITYDPAVTVAPDFWCLQNLELSAGGWPSILSDGGETTTPVHSYYSEGGILYEYMQGPKYCNYMTRIYTDTSLERTTWGGLKTVF